MERFLEHRIADKRVLRLIRKWMTAGVIEDGNWSETVEGAPQGASVTPPTQWATRRLVTLRVRCLVFLVAVVKRSTSSCRSRKHSSRSRPGSCLRPGTRGIWDRPSRTPCLNAWIRGAAASPGMAGRPWARAVFAAVPP